MSKSIFRLNEELKNYDRILNSEHEYNGYFPNQFDFNINQTNDLFNNHQKQFKKQNQFFLSPTSKVYQETENNFISYEDMTTKVDDITNISFHENSLESECGETGLNDLKIYHNTIHISTSNESLESSIDSDDKSNKSVSPKIKFTAPRFQKKWPKTQILYPVVSSDNSSHNSYTMSSQNIGEYSPNQSQQHQAIKSSFSQEVTSAAEIQKNNWFNNRNNNSNKWSNQSSIKLGNKNNHQNFNNNFSKNNSHANSAKYQTSSKNYTANGNESVLASVGNNNSNGSGYRTRNSNKQQANNRYRYNRAGSKSRA